MTKPYNKNRFIYRYKYWNANTSIVMGLNVHWFINIHANNWPGHLEFINPNRFSSVLSEYVLQSNGKKALIIVIIENARPSISGQFFALKKHPFPLDCSTQLFRSSIKLLSTIRNPALFLSIAFIWTLDESRLQKIKKMWTLNFYTCNVLIW